MVHGWQYAWPWHLGTLSVCVSSPSMPYCAHLHPVHASPPAPEPPRPASSSSTPCPLPCCRPKLQQQTRPSGSAASSCSACFIGGSRCRCVPLGLYAWRHAGMFNEQHSHAGLAGGQQLSGEGAVWVAVDRGPSSASGIHCGRSPVLPPVPLSGPVTPLHRT